MKLYKITQNKWINEQTKKSTNTTNICINKEGKNKMKYRKKPVVIEAIQWNGNNIVEIYNFLENKSVTLNSDNKPWSEWWEIQPLPDSYFGFLENYPTLRDYRSNIEDVVFI